MHAQDDAAMPPNVIRFSCHALQFRQIVTSNGIDSRNHAVAAWKLRVRAQLSAKSANCHRR